MYYLQSRYYDPQVGRFVNGDMVEMVILEVQNIYSYCFDSPISMMDINGKLPTFIKNAIKVIKGMITSSVFDIIISTPYAGTGGAYVLPMVAKAISNFKNNNKLEKNSPITKCIDNQGLYKKWMLGWEKLDKCGCELIAVYNVLRCKRKTRTLSSLALQFELSGYVMGCGFLGSSPTKLWSCFAFAGLKYGITFSISELQNKVKEYKYGIISCWNSGNIGKLHTFMIKYDGKNFYSLNGYSERNSATSLSKLISNRKMIVGYWFR
ncbi:MAG: hypothetical protein IKV81_04200 [Clostridia bacterium]|nr:hypothetical protein [Clostridia bacterium]